MKKLLLLAASLLVGGLSSGFSQAAPPTPPPAVPLPGTFQQRLNTVVQRAGNDQSETPALTRFDLDFPGGTPADLVAAIQKAMGKPLNVIIPEEAADTPLPPLKMHDVDVAQLFAALEPASFKTVAITSGQFPNFPGNRPAYTVGTVGYGFRMGPGQASDNSIWYFHVEKPAAPPALPEQKERQFCSFFQLSSLLDRGFTVDDITTAIQTGWKMAGISPAPELSYHKETKLLIAYGTEEKIGIIQQVLNSLPPQSGAAPRSNADALTDQIKQLQQQVADLEKRVSPAPAAPEKSEK
ncbi:MAG TPA: hypothetical protein VL527_07920 [Dongiaceae bacterium]|nr:hypothetical protein [Dongiaceae bacterium]